MNEHVPLVETACGEMEAIEVVRRVGDQIIVRVWNEPRLNHVLQRLGSEGIKYCSLSQRETRRERVWRTQAASNEPTSTEGQARRGEVQKPIVFVSLSITS